MTRSMCSQRGKSTVLVTAPRAFAQLAKYERALGASQCLVRGEPTLERLEEHELLPLVRDIDAIVCGDDRITARVIDAATHLRVIAKWGTGIDSIDVAYAKRKGIVVTNSPGAFSDPVADTVMGYILSFARQLPAMTQQMRAGLWQRPQLLALNECVLGIVGFGGCGQAVARRAKAFGMTVLVNTKDPSPANAAACDGVEFVSLSAALERSNFVTLHADFRPENRYLIDLDELRLMRRDAILVNTARGQLVSEQALVRAIREGWIAGAALDVFEVEPLPQASPLRHLENVFIAPHNANSSATAADRVHDNCIRSVLEVLGRPG